MSPWVPPAQDTLQSYGSMSLRAGSPGHGAAPVIPVSPQVLYGDTISALKDLLKSLLQRSLTPHGLQDMFAVSGFGGLFGEQWGSPGDPRDDKAALEPGGSW